MLFKKNLNNIYFIIFKLFLLLNMFKLVNKCYNLIEI